MKRTATILAIALLAPPLIVYIVLFLIAQAGWGVILRSWFWGAHARHGRPVLFVYSDSPHWASYIEDAILPRLGDRAVVLNWSERRTWPSRARWEARFHRRFAGDRAFNPVAIVFSGGRVEVVRFYRAFLDHTHGRERALREAETRLFTLVETVS